VNGQTVTEAEQMDLQKSCSFGNLIPTLTTACGVSISIRLASDQPKFAPRYIDRKLDGLTKPNLRVQTEFMRWQRRQQNYILDSEFSLMISKHAFNH
jgi:hypothetical protein